MESHKKSSNNSNDYDDILELNCLLLTQEVNRYYDNVCNIYSQTAPNSEDELAILTHINENKSELEHQTPILVGTDNGGESFMANWFLKLGTAHPDFKCSRELFSVLPKKPLVFKIKKRKSDDQSNEGKLEKTEPPLKRTKVKVKKPEKTKKEKYEEITKKRNNKKKSILLEAINPPEVVTQQYRELKGTDLKFVIEKTLAKSDLDRQQDRLTIPEFQIKNEFLNENEKDELLGEVKENEKGLPHIKVKVIEPCLERFDMCLRIWILKVSVSYVLNHKWIQIARREANGFKEHDKVQIWSFRVENQLWFQIVKV